MDSHRHTHRLTATACVSITTVLLLAACGGGQKPPRSSGSARAPQNSDARGAYRFAACMRNHGVTSFQDPRVSTDGNQVKVAIHVDPGITGSPAYASAQRACAHILPGAGNGQTEAQTKAREQAMLAFASCMRRHGFPKFPDPTAQGQLTLAMITRAGIDLSQPAVRPAAYACLPVTHGLLKRADVNQALARSTASDTRSSSAG